MGTNDHQIGSAITRAAAMSPCETDTDIGGIQSGISTTARAGIRPTPPVKCDYYPPCVTGLPGVGESPSPNDNPHGLPRFTQ
jgi:hypothetical protein